MAASSSPDYENTSLSNSLDYEQYDSSNVFLTQYDPFHDFTYTVQTPGVLHPSDNEAMDLRAVAQAAAQTSSKIDYQDFAPRLEGFEDGNVRCLETLE